MATVIFYEKPGCINNTKQKALLQAAGHVLEVHNLLTAAWTTDRLRSFFGNLPVSEWFNPTAPAIKSGAVVPDQLEAEQALSLMIKDPLLIRRPLIQVGDRQSVGFDVAAIDAWIGLQPVSETQQATHQRLIQQDLETCSQTHNPTHAKEYSSHATPG